ncbi:MAG: EamA family transporter [Candidatus Methanomethylophilaceae archaeon]|nr:EamA family transporter [Candidatus Methanomethylophilaceae archaeon]
MNQKRIIGVSAVLIATMCFGFLGLFNRFLQNDFGLASIDVTFVRLSFASMILLIILAIFAPGTLRIRLKDTPYILLFAIFKLLSDLFLFNAQTTTSLSLATLLQMTSPYFIMVFSFLLFKEKITAKKFIAMIIASIGCVLVTHVVTGHLSLDAAGILSGIMSGLCYGLFLLGNKVYYDRGMNPAASLFYTFLFASVIILPFIHFEPLGNTITDITGLGACLVFGAVLTLVPFYLLAISLRYLEPTTVSVLGVMELVASTMVGFFFFDEVLETVDIGGILLVIASVFIINAEIFLWFRRKYGEYRHVPDKPEKELSGAIAMNRTFDEDMRDRQ